MYMYMLLLLLLYMCARIHGCAEGEARRRDAAPPCGETWMGKACGEAERNAAARRGWLARTLSRDADKVIARLEAAADAVAREAAVAGLLAGLDPQQPRLAEVALPIRLEGEANGAAGRVGSERVLLRERLGESTLDVPCGARGRHATHGRAVRRQHQPLWKSGKMSKCDASPIQKNISNKEIYKAKIWYVPNVDRVIISRKHCLLTPFDMVLPLWQEKAKNVFRSVPSYLPLKGNIIGSPCCYPLGGPIPGMLLCCCQL